MNSCDHQCGSCAQACSERTEPRESLKAPLAPGSRVGKVIGVVSGKGGVGKSLITGLLASKMQARGAHAAVMDADITGPSIPRLFGMTGRLMGDEEGFVPIRSTGGVDVVSMNLILEKPTDPVVWRGSIIAGVVRQFWSDVIWKDVDYMFIDMPPGTGDVALTVYQSLPVDAVVIVTSPQELVSMIVEKAVNMARLEGLDMNVIGLVENYSYCECPHCGEKMTIFGESRVEETAARYGIPHVARLPLDPAIAQACDAGAVESIDSPWLDAVADALEAL
ncbi:P-loop NTPase [Mailhella massiliensis]|uniref:Iron-sulfur cluster carrier protein n=1 Tax=Mailhella massiliensis TaxID=1903261 RepID=A0A921AXG1_9BACT|nr:P-loop NTPase [Mailhella massiliensis]HJD97558.1 Mrp/NBP35 family ATP-binding protein [Mailhella massiliensis]